MGALDAPGYSRYEAERKFEGRSEAFVRRAVQPYNLNTLRSSLLTVSDAAATTITSAKAVKVLKTVPCNVSNGSNVLTASSTTYFDLQDVGRGIGASGDIPSGTTILEVTSKTTALMSAAATGTTNNRDITVNRLSDQMRFYGGAYLGRKGSVHPETVQLDAQANVPAGMYVADTYVIQGAHYGQKFELSAFVAGATPLSQVRVWVDEGYGWRAVTAAPYLVTASASRRYVLFDFGSAAHRQVRIECAGAVKAVEIMIGPTDTWWRGYGPAPVRVAFIGDSYFEGNYGPGPVARWQTPWSQVSKVLGWGDPHNRGQGGTGYLNNGAAVRATNAILRNRLAEVISLNPDGWVIALGVNDTDFTQAQIYAEALYCFNYLKAQLPKAFGYVVGPWSTGTTVQANGKLAELSAGVRQAAREAKLSFIEPQSGDIVTADNTVLVAGTGPIIAGQSNSSNLNGATFFHTDNLHLSAAGNEYIGSFIASGIQTLQAYESMGRY